MTNTTSNFVVLNDYIPNVRVNLRYFSENNFIGKIIAGYHANKAFGTKEMADALLKAQAQFNKDGYSIIIYDSYRPQQAVDSFIAWSQDPNDQAMKHLYYPYINKADLFDLGYLARKSGHSRGSTIDLSLIKLDQIPYEPVEEIRILSDGTQIVFLNDGSVDMGGSFDLLHEVSHHDNNLIGQEYKEMRNYLKDVMVTCGFKPYSKEWWHFTLENEPFPDQYFDFPII